MSVSNLPPLGGHGDEEPQHALSAQPIYLCAHADCRAILPSGWLYPLCPPCKACECLVCGAEIVPVDGHLCWVCQQTRELFAPLWTPWRDAYKAGVYQP